MCGNSKAGPFFHTPNGSACSSKVAEVSHCHDVTASQERRPPTPAESGTCIGVFFFFFFFLSRRRLPLSPYWGVSKPFLVWNLGEPSAANAVLLSSPILILSPAPPTPRPPRPAFVLLFAALSFHNRTLSVSSTGRCRKYTIGKAGLPEKLNLGT